VDVDSNFTSGSWEGDQRALYQALENAKRLEAANSHLQSELKHLQADRQNLSPELAATRQRLAHAEAQLGASNRDLGLTRGAVAQLEESIQAVVAERDELAGKQVSLEWKLTELEASLRNAESECLRLHVVGEDLIKARDQISELEWERDELQRELEQIQRDLAETGNGRELAALRAREKTLEAEKDRISKALNESTQDAERFAELNAKAREQLESMHRRCADAEKRAESSSASEIGRDNEILRGILARQKEELEQRYKELLALRRAKFALRITYWIFAVGALFVAAFGLKVLSGVL
jgi:chromosome segregation ATPase